MPALYLMTWNGDQCRWLKWYRGRMYAVSARQLKADPTKEGSRQRANDWWTAKQAQIDKELGEAKKHPAELVKAFRDAIEKHRLYAKWLRRYGEKEEGAIEKAGQAEAVVEWLKEALQTDSPPYPLTPEQSNPLVRDMNLDHHKYVRWLERLQQIKREEQAETAAPKENSIRAYIDLYLATLKTIATANGKIGTFDTTRYRLNEFRKWCDPQAPIEALNETLWERFSLYLFGLVSSKTMSPASMAGFQRSARSFIRDCYNRRFIELPRNLTARNLSACVPLKEPQTLTADEVKQFMGAASERKKLYLLLMLNTGMYPSDIAKLEQNEVDWKAGRINRKRTKTRDRSGNVPKVEYLLWRETFDLLKKHRSDHPTLVLLNKNGTPLWVEGEKDGKFSRNSNIKTAYFQLQQKLGMTKDDRKGKSLKAFRKTPASMLENHAEYGRYAEHFLGEAPKTVASRHYIKPSREQFDNAIKWLGKQFKIL